MNLCYLKGRELAKRDIEAYGYNSTLKTYINYMEDPLVEYYHEDVREEIKGYCDEFAETNVTIKINKNVG